MRLRRCLHNECTPAISHSYSQHQRWLIVKEIPSTTAARDRSHVLSKMPPKRMMLLTAGFKLFSCRKKSPLLRPSLPEASDLESDVPNLPGGRMFCLRIFSLVLLLSAFAAAQVTVIRGTASNWA